MASAVVVRGLAAGYGGLGLVGCDGMQALVSLSIRAITFSSPGKKEPTLSGRVGRSRFAASRCDGACAETEVNLSLSLSLSLLQRGVLVACGLSIFQFRLSSLPEK
jgi:hypothetical protein